MLSKPDHYYRNEDSTNLVPVQQLPDKPSELIEVALADLKKVEALEEFIVDMGTWHAMSYDCQAERERCFVCAAGAVMAMHLNVPTEVAINPDRFDHDTRKKLIAIDHLRCGCVAEAFATLWGNFKDGERFDRTTFPSYRRDSEAFYEAMEQLGKELKDAGY
jgi:hypothetical protein